MRSFLACAFAVLATACAAGCGGNVVVDKPGGTGAAAGSTPAGGGGTGGVGGTAPVGGGGNGGSTGTGKPGSPGHALIVNQGTVTVLFSSQDVTCKNPSPKNNGCGWWNVTISMPEDLLVPSTIDLSTASNVSVLFQEAGNSIGGTSCPSSAGGGQIPAKLTIQSVKQESAELSIEGFTTLMLDGEPDGSYHALRCKNAN